MPSTANKGYTVPTTGSESGTWGTDVNANFTSIVDLNLGGVLVIALTNANVTLTATQSQYGTLRLTGSLSGNVIVTTSNIGFWCAENFTSNNFSVTISNGVGSGYVPPQNVSRQVISDSTYGVRATGLAPPGTMLDYGGPADSFPLWLAGEYVLANGAAISRTTYATLFSIYGTTFGSGDGSTTFNVPDTRGRSTSGKDDMGGTAAQNRITNALSGIVGTTLGAAGGEQNHTLSSTEMPVHNHGYSDPGHSHTYGNPNPLNIGSGGSPVINGGGGSYSTGTSGIGITISNAGSGGGHNNMQPTIIVNKMIRW